MQEARYELRLMLEGMDRAARTRFEVAKQDDLFALAMLPVDVVADVRAIWPVRTGTFKLRPQAPDWLDKLVAEIEERMLQQVRRIPASLCVPTPTVEAFTLLKELTRGILLPESLRFLGSHAALATPARKKELFEWASQLAEASSKSDQIKQSLLEAQPDTSDQTQHFAAALMQRRSAE